MKKKSNLILPVIFVAMAVIGIIALIAAVAIKGTEDPDPVKNALTYVGFSLVALSAVMALVNVIYALISIFVPSYPSYKTVIILKFALVPCNVVILICLLLFSTILLTFIKHSTVGIFIFTGLLLIYLYMISSSLTNLASVIRGIKSKEIKVNFTVVIALIMHFCFPFDILGAIILNVEMKKQKKNKQISESLNYSDAKQENPEAL